MGHIIQINWIIIFVGYIIIIIWGLFIITKHGPIYYIIIKIRVKQLIIIVHIN